MSKLSSQTSWVKTFANANAVLQQEQIGNVTGSEAWKSSGAEQKQAGINDMKKAGEQRNPDQQGYGKVEALAGKAVGCEGMEKEGEQSKKE